MAAAGQVNEAYEMYVDMSGKHHNVYFPAGFAALKLAMIDSHSAEPNKTFTPINAICEGDLVAVHSRLIRQKDAPEISVVHILRVKNGKIVEMWDTGAEIPANSPNIDGAF